MLWKGIACYRRWVDGMFLQTFCLIQFSMLTHILCLQESWYWHHSRKMYFEARNKVDLKERECRNREREKALQVKSNQWRFVDIVERRLTCILKQLVHWIQKQREAKPLDAWTLLSFENSCLLEYIEFLNFCKVFVGSLNMWNSCLLEYMEFLQRFTWI